LFADARPAFQAPSAAAAAGAELKDEVIARLDVANAGADFHDLASALMAADHRQRTRSVAVDDGEIGMAEAAAADLDEHFSRLRRIQLHFFDADRAALGEWLLCAALDEDGCFHLHGDPSGCFAAC